MLGNSIGEIFLDLKINDRDYRKQLTTVANQTEKQFNNTSRGIENSFGGAFSRIGKMAAGAFLVGTIGKFIGSCIELGSTLAEVQNVVDVAFPTMNGKINEFSKNAMTQFGLSESVAKKYAGTFGSMAKSFKFSEGAAADMSMQLTGLAGDVSSFYNISSDEAYTKLKSVFTGETESLKDLGVVMTQSALDAYALSNGFGKTTAKMSEHEKVALRLAFVQEQLTDASGDFVRTQDSWANQTRVLSLQFDSLKASLGKGFIALFTPIIKGINWVLSNLRVLADSFANMMEFLTGTSSGTSGGISNDLSSAGNSAGDLSDGLSDAGKNGEKAAKKINKAFSKVDTINKLSFDSGNEDSKGPGTSAGSSGGVADAVDFTKQTESSSAFAKVLQPLFDILNKFKTISFDNLVASFGNLGRAISPIVGTLFDGLLWALDNVIYPLTKVIIEDYLPAFFNLLAGALTIVNPILKAFGDIFIVIWDNVLAPIASWTGAVFITAMNTIAGVLKNIGDWMTNNQGTVTTITAIVLGFCAAWKITEMLAFIQMSGGLVATLGIIKTAIMGATVAKLADKLETMAITALCAKDFVVSLAASTGALIKQAAQWVINTGAKIADTAATIAGTIATGAATAATWLFNTALAVLTSPITLVVVAIGVLIAIVVALVKNWDTVKQVASNVWNGVVGIWNAAGSWFNSNVTQPISNAFNNLWSGIKKVASNAWNFILGLFAKGGKIFSGVTTGISNIFKSIVNSIIKGINSVISFPFNKINGLLNGIRNFDIPLIGKPFKGLWGQNPLTVPQIPMLAQGGYVGANQPQLAMIGDNRHQGEVVAPEGKLLDIVNTALKMQKDNGNVDGIDTLISLIKELIELVKNMVIKVDIDIKKLSILLENAKKERQMIGG